jgi:hypothetical protein
MFQAADPQFPFPEKLRPLATHRGTLSIYGINLPLGSA